MSRKIEPRTSATMTEPETKLRKTDTGKLLFTTYRERSCAMLLQNDRLTAASFFPERPNRIGAIYVGKVKNVARNLDACFVEIANGESCFLPMKNASMPFLLNRSFDGRILEGDELLVQVDRDAQKSKQPAVTAQISLSNDYFVMTFGSAKAGYSSKLSTECREAVSVIFTEKGIMKNGALIQDCRILLSDIGYKKLESEGLAVEKLHLPSIGLIFRTRVGESESGDEMPEHLLLEHFYALSAQFIKLLCIAAHRSCFSCLKDAPTVFEASIRQFSSDEYEEIVTDREDFFEELQKYCEEHAPEKKVRLYRDSLRLSLSALYSLDSKMDVALGSRVWLKSGGYLIIEPTEALTVIDVNSGKYEVKKEAADACRKINREAAEEVAVQLRLRNLSGIIIVDFISMRNSEDKSELLNYLKTLVKRDKIRTTIVDMTPLGLVEITRKKIDKPLREQFLSKE